MRCRIDLGKLDATIRKVSRRVCLTPSSGVNFRALITPATAFSSTVCSILKLAGFFCSKNSLVKVAVSVWFSVDGFLVRSNKQKNG
mmetsp:Transcript_54135/g.61961  ORF Transcript_54135/g.61961 Transcript_54135/m.61961 type:complete len:86 (+) Transcript_54135:2393-2650(+)